MPPDALPSLASEGSRKSTKIMSQIGVGGAGEGGGEGEWRVWREADSISRLMSKAGKRAKSHSPCPQCICTRRRDGETPTAQIAREPEALAAKA